MENNVVAFSDGDDFVIMFKKCPAEQKEILKNLFGANYVGDAEAVPVDRGEEVVTSKPSVEPEKKTFVFETGPAKGRTPEDVLTDGDKGFYIVSSAVNQKIIPETEIHRIGKLLNEFLKNRFASITDPYEYVAGINEKQCFNFFRLYDNAISKKIKDAFASQSGSVSFDVFKKEATLEQKRSAIAALIENFKKL